MTRIKPPPADEPGVNARWEAECADFERAVGPKTHPVWTAVNWAQARVAVAHRNAAIRALDRGDTRRAGEHIKAAEILETTEDDSK